MMLESVGLIATDSACVQSPVLRQRLTAMGAEPYGSTPEAFATFLRSEIAKWAKVVKAAGLDKE